MDLDLVNMKVTAQIRTTKSSTTTVRINLLELFISDCYRPHIVAAFTGDMLNDSCIGMSDTTMHLGNPFLVHKKDFAFELFQMFSSTVEEKEIIEKGKACIFEYYLGKQIETEKQRVAKLMMQMAKKEKNDSQVKVRFQLKSIKEIVEDVCADWNTTDKIVMTKHANNYIEWRKTEMRALYAVDVMMRQNNLGRGFLINSICEKMQKYSRNGAIYVIVDAIGRVEKSAQFALFVFLIRSRSSRRKITHVDLIQMDCYSLASLEKSVKSTKTGKSWEFFVDLQEIWITWKRYMKDCKQSFTITPRYKRVVKHTETYFDAASLFADFEKKMSLNENNRLLDRAIIRKRIPLLFWKEIFLRMFVKPEENLLGVKLHGIKLTKKKDDDTANTKKRSKSKEAKNRNQKKIKQNEIK